MNSARKRRPRIRIPNVFQRSSTAHFKRPLAHFAGKLFKGRPRCAERRRTIDIADQGRIEEISSCPPLTMRCPSSEGLPTVPVTARPPERSPSNSRIFGNSGLRTPKSNFGISKLAENRPAGSSQRRLPSTVLTRPNGASAFNIAGGRPGEASSPSTTPGRWRCIVA